MPGLRPRSRPYAVTTRLSPGRDASLGQACPTQPRPTGRLTRGPPTVLHLQGDRLPVAAPAFPSAPPPGSASREAFVPADFKFIGFLPRHELYLAAVTRVRFEKQGVGGKPASALCGADSPRAGHLVPSSVLPTGREAGPAPLCCPHDGA